MRIYKKDLYATRAAQGWRVYGVGVWGSTLFIGYTKREAIEAAWQQVKGARA